jgi:tRNA(adenine34) deaminase
MVPQDLRLNHRAEVIPGVLAEECSQVLEDFFRARRRALNNRLENRP